MAPESMILLVWIKLCPLLVVRKGIVTMRVYREEEGLQYMCGKGLCGSISPTELLKACLVMA